MTDGQDDGGCLDLHAQDLKMDSHDANSSRLDALHEENEVLQFLLGKTHSIKSDDTSSVTSTSSSSHSHSDSQSHSEDSAVDWSTRDTPDAVDAPSPELEPICESASEDDISSPHKPELRVTVFDSASLYATVTQWTSALTARLSSVKVSSPATGPPETEAMNLTTVEPLQKPAMQPEDGDPGAIEESKGLRQRRRSTSANKVAIAPTAQLEGKPQTPTVWEKSLDSILAHSDSIFVATVLAVLCGYCVAIGYRIFHPVVYPLPNVDALFKPWDASNITARFVSPLLDSEYTGAIPIEWEIVNFPTNALREGGVEPFEYQLFLDDRRIQFEVSYWSLPTNYNESVLNVTMYHRLRPRDLDGVGYHKLRLEVTFPIPGSDGELRTLTDTTAFSVVAPESSEPSLRIKSPVDGAVVETSELYVLVLEFEALNVHRVDVILDEKARLRMVHWRDGNLLLRGIGVGKHRILVEAFNDQGTVVAKQSTRMEVRAKADPSRHEAGV